VSCGKSCCRLSAVKKLKIVWWKPLKVVKNSSIYVFTVPSEKSLKAGPGVLSDLHYEKVGFYKKLLPGSTPLVGFWLLGGQKPKPKVKPNTPLVHFLSAIRYTHCIVSSSTRVVSCLAKMLLYLMFYLNCPTSHAVILVRRAS
jgi:hypothetical protein